MLFFMVVNQSTIHSVTPLELPRAEQIPIMVRTLVASGFVLDNVSRRPNYALFACHRYDEFGVSIPYVFALCEEPLDSPAAKAIERAAAQRMAHPLVVGEGTAGLPWLSWSDFLARCGGPIKSWLPLEPSFRDDLLSLGHNQPVVGLAGNPDDLFEEYVQVALQFLLGDRVIRYGQERRFEALPDGVAFAREHITLLYDAKAYAKGYEVTRDSVRQFSDYVRNFHRKYEHYIGRVYAFLLISGRFSGGKLALANQARAMYEECGVPLAYLPASDLGDATALLVKNPALRNTVDWRQVFSHTQVTRGVIEKVVAANTADRLVRVRT